MEAWWVLFPSITSKGGLYDVFQTNRVCGHCRGCLLAGGDAMRVLVACEFSGIVRDAFIRRGHDAWSCDLLPTERPGPHIQDDVLKHLEGWDMIIAHPPCTFLANSGARWLFEKEGRWEQLAKACEFFNVFLNAPAKFIAVENPMPHKWATEKIGKYNFKVHPWEHGHKQKKTTCFWVRNLPCLLPSAMVGPPPKNDKTWESIWREPPGKDQSKNRSRTFTGIAKAIADQWSNL